MKRVEAKKRVAEQYLLLLAPVMFSDARKPNKLTCGSKTEVYTYRLKVRTGSESSDVVRATLESLNSTRRARQWSSTLGKVRFRVLASC